MAEEAELRLNAIPNHFTRRPDMQEFKEKIQQLQAEALEQLEQKLQQLTEAALQAAEGPATLAPLSHSLLYDGDKYRNRQQPARDGMLPEKQFLPRESLLTHLLRIKHFRTVYNIFVAMLLIQFLHTAVYDFVADGRLKLGLSTVYWNFGGLHVVVVCWLCMQAASCCLYVAFCSWALLRVSQPAHGTRQWMLDYGALITLVVFQVLLLLSPMQVVQTNRLPPVSAMVILAEQIRMMMKVHAFVRSNVPSVLKYKPHTESSSRLVPEFSRFLYFLFVPTLVYRDSYPRTKEIRWSVVAWHLAEVASVVFFVSFVMERSLLPVFRDFGAQPACPRALVAAVFGSMVPSLSVFLSCFYCILHAWPNAFAEMTRFADRMFYKDWWNARSYAAYFRTWNVIVHDWLYEFVYRDLCLLLGPGRRVLPTLAVFLLSAGVHEYIVTYTFGFCYPMLFIAFGVFSVGLVFVTHDQLRGGNVLMWLLVSIGTGVLTSAYLMEWFARQHCPRLIDASWDFFVPRSWFCFAAPLLN